MTRTIRTTRTTVPVHLLNRLFEALGQLPLLQVVNVCMEGRVVLFDVPVQGNRPVSRGRGLIKARRGGVSATEAFHEVHSRAQELLLPVFLRPLAVPPRLFFLVNQQQTVHLRHVLCLNGDRNKGWRGRASATTEK